MTLVIILCLAAFFGLIFWAEIYYGKLKKKQVLKGIKAVGIGLLVILYWRIGHEKIGGIELQFILLGGLLLWMVISLVRSKMSTGMDRNSKNTNSL